MNKRGIGIIEIIVAIGVIGSVAVFVIEKLGRGTT